MTSGRWLRIAPDDSSTPLQTMSYWIALMPRSLSWSLRVEREELVDAMFGIENGLCEKSIFFSSSFHSYIGKSTIQQKLEAVLVDQAELLADLGARAARRTSRSPSGMPATKNTASPTPRPS